MDVLDELTAFYFNFKGQKGHIGLSERGQPILYFKVRKTERPVVILQYAIHAREYITTYLALKHITDFYYNGEHGTVYFVPAVNPDGILISLNGNPLYKANANGVDLNVNFDARWGTGAKNTINKGAENCIGEKPFSESESSSLAKFTLSVNPDATVSYHSKGEEIYWEFFQTGENRRRDFSLAKLLSRVTGYAVKSTPNSAGGYKDWCVEKLKIPAFTIEVGSDSLSHPIKKDNLEPIYRKNKDVVKVITEYLWKKNL